MWFSEFFAVLFTLVLRHLIIRLTNPPISSKTVSSKRFFFLYLDEYRFLDRRALVANAKEDRLHLHRLPFGHLVTVSPHSYMPTPLLYLFTFSHNLEFRGLFVHQLEATEFAAIWVSEDSILTGRRYCPKHWLFVSRYD